MAEPPLNSFAPPVMILGCGRSGTSILGELFDYIDGYQYRSEPPFEDVVNADYSTPRAFKVPRESEAHRPDPGLSFPLSDLLDRAPDMRFIWIVRHPLDAICSLKVGISKHWGHHPRPPDWQEWLDRTLAEQCAHHWTHINSVGFELVRDVATLVHFEAMIRDPEAFARRTCEAINIDLGSHRNAIGLWANRIQNTNNADFVEAETSQAYSRPDHAVRIDRWRENLERPEIRRILPIVARTALTFGYDLAGV